VQLDEYIEELEPDPDAERRRLAEERSYEVLDHLEDVEARVDEALQGDSLFGSTAPSVFVGRTGYPRVSTGILSPVAGADAPGEFRTSGEWYQRGLDIDDVLQYRTGLLNSRQQSGVDVHETWDGFVGVQREVAISDRPVDVEIGLSETPDIDLSLDDVATPTGPTAQARDATVTENPHVPPAVEKTLEDDEWNAQGAMTYLYRRGLDVYDINNVLSVGALGKGPNRRLVPTRWSITAVDDAIGTYLHGQVRNNPSIDQVEVRANAYMGNRYWVILTPGSWEFELVEMKAPGSVWNPAGDGNVWVGSASEGYRGRTEYVEETAGAYYAARLGVLEHLADRDRQAKALVLREVSDEYWAPVGVWQVRESVRNAFGDAPTPAAPDLAGRAGTAETFAGAIQRIVAELPISLSRLQRNSELVVGRQASLGNFSPD
jgi:hypothetical protein